MANSLDKFIQLNRTFHSLNVEGNVTDDIEPYQQLGKLKKLNWSDLIEEHRVILLSEAGAGKTQEIRNTTQLLRKEGKSAFFIRIEHVTQSFEDAFEEGSFEEFNNWCDSGLEGWLFLDSVDEARLRDPKDFERAIKVLGRKLSLVLQKAHIVITGRSTAWRAKTDLLLCENIFPYMPPMIIETEAVPDDQVHSFNTNFVEHPLNEIGQFKVVALDDLHGDQINAFLHGKNVHDVESFRIAVDRKDAWSLTTRPQDLDELIEFWKSHHLIGSRLELLKESISRRLQERDQDRAEARPISAEKLHYGVRLIAAATTLAQQSAIRVPDGTENSRGIPIRDVLSDWNDTDCLTLLGRPIFDEGIYGTVRFHHRSVREYLTAEWLHSLIVDEGSRVRIENLFFRWQYGIEVIVPNMRPILPWLAILDEHILTRIIKLAPEVIFEGGDPSQLPLDTRIQFLRIACSQLKNPAHPRTLTDYSAIQRFANADLADEINSLLIQYSKNDVITEFLLQIIWRGEIVAAVSQTKHFALTSKSKYTRIAAFHALAAIGTPIDQHEVRQSLITPKVLINREWVAELIESLPKDEESVSWLLIALERTPEKRQFEVDNLMEALSLYASNLSLQLLHKLIPGINALVQKPPFIERTHCEASTHFSWLLETAAESLLRLIKDKDEWIFQTAALSLLSVIPIVRTYGDYDNHELGKELGQYIKLWPELCHKLFWHDVPITRTSLHKINQKLTHFWQVSSFTSYWIFNLSDFDTICNDIINRELIDDRVLSLQIAYSLYRENGRPQAKLRRLKRLALSEPALESALYSLLHPPLNDRRQFRQMEASWRRKSKQIAIKRVEEKRLSIIYLSSHLNEFNGSNNSGIANNSQYYLHHHMREMDNQTGNWSQGKWEVLIKEFGQEIAKAFRDGAIKFWRHHRPILQSEGAEKNATPFNVIFGLTGLAIESREVPNWISQITSKDAEIATRYALNELNGFPRWLPELYANYPQILIDLVMQEIDFELKNGGKDQGSQYVLSDVSWSGNWIWDGVAPMLIKRLNKPTKNVANLRYILKIIEGSSIDNESIAKIAEKKSLMKNITASAPMWFALWVGTNPAAAIPALVTRLERIKSEEEKTLFAMQFLSALVGGRREGHIARLEFRNVIHMKALYVLMHKYIRENEDIDRANGGVYSPGLRDDAQDARNALLSFIRETPGKDAYLALTEIAKSHPSEKSRPWMEMYAKNKAVLDASSPPWTAQQVQEFHHELERTPSNHKDLWYLAIERLNDIKYNLEDGDSSIASILLSKEETEIRKYIGNWCREHSGTRYSFPQEEELADAKRPDFRFHGMGFDGPVPVELKLADKWTGPSLFERLEVQLCGDYLRDIHSSRGIFILVFSGRKTSWEYPRGNSIDSFSELVDVLQNHWDFLSPNFPNVEDIKVIGIDLTKRGIDTKHSQINKLVKTSSKSKSTNAI